MNSADILTSSQNVRTTFSSDQKSANLDHILVVPLGSTAVNLAFINTVPERVGAIVELHRFIVALPRIAIFSGHRSKLSRLLEIGHRVNHKYYFQSATNVLVQKEKERSI